MGPGWGEAGQLPGPCGGRPTCLRQKESLLEEFESGKTWPDSPFWEVGAEAWVVCLSGGATFLWEGIGGQQHSLSPSPDGILQQRVF